MFKVSNVDIVYYDDFDDDVHNYDSAAGDDEYRKIRSVKRWFEGLNNNYFKPIKTDDSFGCKKI